MDRGAWQATVHRVTKSRTPLKQLSMHAQLHLNMETEAWKICHILYQEVTHLHYNIFLNQEVD